MPRLREMAPPRGYVRGNGQDGGSPGLPASSSLHYSPYIRPVLAKLAFASQAVRAGGLSQGWSRRLPVARGAPNTSFHLFGRICHEKLRRFGSRYSWPGASWRWDAGGRAITRRRST